jgi:16S rRNA (guanine966-N2)-methyltransferase
MLRVIGGAFKGRQLKMVRSPLVRPMPAKLKEALFNIGAIQEKIKGAAVLDGFAGTGSIGIEALEPRRRAARLHRRILSRRKTIKLNLVKCEAGDRAASSPRNSTAP